MAASFLPGRKGHPRHTTGTSTRWAIDLTRPSDSKLMPDQGQQTGSRAESVRQVRQVAHIFQFVQDYFVYQDLLNIR